MHIFISYAKVDTQPLALKIREALRSVNGLTAWMDESLESGEDWAVQIQDEIDRCDLMLVLISPNVNRTSEPRSFVLREIHYAQDSQKSILPIMAQKTRIPVQLAGIQYVDLTQNQAAGIKDLVENVCRRLGVTSPAELKRQAEEAERQRVAEIHRQTVEAEQKKQAQIAAQRQAEENERRRQAQIEAQRRADEQARQQQNAQTAPSIPVMQPRPNAPQNWDKQNSEGASAAYEAKVRVAGPSKSKVPVSFLAGGAVLAAIIIIVIVGLLLSGVLGGDDKNNKNNDVRYQAIFDSNHTVTTSEGNVCTFYAISVNNKTNLEIKLESPNNALTQIGESPQLSLELYKNSENWGTGSTQATFLASVHYYQTLTAEVESGDYVICLTATGGEYYSSNVKDDSFWVTINLTE